MHHEKTNGPGMAASLRLISPVRASKPVNRNFEAARHLKADETVRMYTLLL
jgi:hypothetical protein